MDGDMINRMLVVVLIVVSLGVSLASSEESGASFGGVIGSVNGLSAKMWLNPTTALDGALSFSTVGSFFGLYLHTDFLMHEFAAAKVEKGRLPLYWGVGVSLQATDKTNNVGIRVPLGAAYILDKAPIDVFVELVPTLGVTAPVSFNFTGELGIRYSFSAPKDNDKK